jgi:hypothetical protein
MTKQLSISQKNEYFSDLVARDGYKCYQCGGSFENHNHIYEHLNDDRSDNRFENTAFCCYSCNNKKPYSIDMRIKAREKLRQNEEGNFVRERKNVGNDSKEVSAEIEINTSNYEITEQHISEKIKVDGFVGYADALDSSVYLCKVKTGHGSQQSVRNYIASLTSVVGPFQIVRNQDKKKIIIKRSDN